MTSLSIDGDSAVQGGSNSVIAIEIIIGLCITESLYKCPTYNNRPPSHASIRLLFFYNSSLLLT